MGSTLGDRFKKLRQEKGLKQEELVKDFNKKYHYNFTRAAISQYENDKRIPEIEALQAFANYFDVTVDYLLGRTDIKNPSLFEGSGIIKKALEEVDIVAEAVKDNPELQEIVSTLEKREDLMVMFKKSKRLTPDAVKKILEIIKLIEDKESAET